MFFCFLFLCFCVYLWFVFCQLYIKIRVTFFPIKQDRFWSNLTSIYLVITVFVFYVCVTERTGSEPVLNRFKLGFCVYLWLVF